MLKGVVRSVKGRVPSMVDGESLEAAAMLGLLQAFEGFDASKGVPFETYARIRVRGAVQDELRSLDHLTRRQRRRVRSVAESREKIERATGAPADDASIAAGANITVEQLSRAAQLPSAPQSIDPSLLSEMALESCWQNNSDMEHALIQKERIELLTEALENLPEREKTIMSLYYKDELTLQEIGDMFGVTQSRVSQIISKVKRRLQTELADA
jgi:RNA polymerase sigma factor for flagellar operon FliA